MPTNHPPTTRSSDTLIKGALVAAIILVILILGFYMSTLRNASLPEGNRLRHAASPYLLKHATNPVDWYQWGPEAIDRARKEQKLIFLSIGYTACHWCNELEKECFEHDDFASVINRRYVSIKVDREERPDLDEIYMQAAIGLRGSGGWPNNVILTPDELAPVYAIGYQKKEAFKEILIRVERFWKEDKEKMIAGGATINQKIKEEMERSHSAETAPTLNLEPLRAYFDLKRGGIGQGAKFPHAPLLSFLMTEGKDDPFVRTTLEAMASRGLYDHIGGGFHRYTVDPEWDVPHFEKMLYDNAMLASLYAQAAIIYDEPAYAEVARHALAFVKRELSNSEGGFLSSLDADSGGVEGAYYTVTLEEAKKLGLSDQFIEDYGLTKEGNVDDITFTAGGPVSNPTGRNTLRRQSDRRHLEALARLYKERQSRIRPPKDDKVVASWHALMVAAFVDVALATGDAKLLEQAKLGGRFSLSQLESVHNYRNGHGYGQQNMNDLTFHAWAYWRLFVATGETVWLEASRKAVDRAKRLFTASDGGYYLVEAADDLIARPRVSADNPLPASSATLARTDLRLAVILGNNERKATARITANHLLAASGGANIYSAEAMSLFREGEAEPVEIVYAFAPGEKDRLAWLKAGVSRRWGAVQIPLGAYGIDPALSEGRYPVEKSVAHVCKGTICLRPARSPDELSARLTELQD